MGQEQSTTNSKNEPGEYLAAEEKSRLDFQRRVALAKSKTADQIFTGLHFFFSDVPQIHRDEVLLRDCKAILEPSDTAYGSVSGYMDRLYIIKVPSDSNPEHFHYIFYNNSPALRFNIQYHFPPKHGTIKAVGSVDINNSVGGWTTLTMVLDPNEYARFVGSPRDCTKLNLIHDFKAVPLPQTYNRRAARKSDDEIRKFFLLKTKQGEKFHSMTSEAVVGAAPVDRQSALTTEFLKFCISGKLQFIDPMWRPSSASLGSAFNLPWRAAGSLNPCSKITVGGKKNIRPELLAPGQLGESWVTSAIASLALAPDRLRTQTLVGTLAEQAVGAYVVRINKDGWWRYVVLDEYFPCVGYRLAFLSNATEKCTDPVDIYASLLQKAYALLHGSYTNIATPAGDHLEAQQDFTGYPVFNFDEDWALVRRQQCVVRRSRAVKRRDANLNKLVCFLPQKGGNNKGGNNNNTNNNKSAQHNNNNHGELTNESFIFSGDFNPNGSSTTDGAKNKNSLQIGEITKNNNNNLDNQNPALTSPGANAANLNVMMSNNNINAQQQQQQKQQLDAFKFEAAKNIADFLTLDGFKVRKRATDCTIGNNEEEFEQYLMGYTKNNKKSSAGNNDDQDDDDEESDDDDDDDSDDSDEDDAVAAKEKEKKRMQEEKRKAEEAERREKERQIRDDAKARAKKLQPNATSGGIERSKTNSNSDNTKSSKQHKDDDDGFDEIEAADHEPDTKKNTGASASSLKSNSNINKSSSNMRLKSNSVVSSPLLPHATKSVRIAPSVAQQQQNKIGVNTVDSSILDEREESEEEKTQRFREEGAAAADRIFQQLHHHVEEELHLASLCTPNADNDDILKLYLVRDAMTLERLFTEMGLTMGRAYFVTRVVHDKTLNIKLLKLREPWLAMVGSESSRANSENSSNNNNNGSGGSSSPSYESLVQWNGMWGNSSPVWAKYPALAEECGMKHMLVGHSSQVPVAAATTTTTTTASASSSHDDPTKAITGYDNTITKAMFGANNKLTRGMNDGFWMEWSDVQKYFNSGGVCYACRYDLPDSIKMLKTAVSKNQIVESSSSSSSSSSANKKDKKDKNAKKNMNSNNAETASVPRNQITARLLFCRFDYRIRGDFLGVVPNVALEIENHSTEPIRIFLILSQIDRRGLEKNHILRDTEYAGLNLVRGVIGPVRLKKRTPDELTKAIAEFDENERLLAEETAAKEAAKLEKELAEAAAKGEKITEEEKAKKVKSCRFRCHGGFFQKKEDKRNQAMEQRKKEEVLRWTSGQVCTLEGSSGISVDQPFEYGKFSFVHGRDVAAEWMLEGTTEANKEHRTQVIIPRLSFSDQLLTTMILRHAAGSSSSTAKSMEKNGNISPQNESPGSVTPTTATETSFNAPGVQDNMSFSKHAERFNNNSSITPTANASGGNSASALNALNSSSALNLLASSSSLLAQLANSNLNNNSNSNFNTNAITVESLLKIKTPYVLGIISSVPVGPKTFTVKFKKLSTNTKLFNENLPAFWYTAKEAKETQYQVPYRLEGTNGLKDGRFDPSVWKVGAEILDPEQAL